MKIQKFTLLMTAVLSADSFYPKGGGGGHGSSSSTGSGFSGGRSRTPAATKPTSSSSSSSSFSSIIPFYKSSTRPSSTSTDSTSSKSAEYKRPSAGMAAAAIGAAALGGATIAALASENKESSFGHSSSHSSGSSLSNYGQHDYSSYPVNNSYNDYPNHNERLFAWRYMISGMVGACSGWTVWSNKNILNLIKNQIKEGVNPHNAQLGIASFTACMSSLLVYVGLKHLESSYVSEAS